MQGNHSAWCFGECLVLVTENEDMIPVGHPASLPYPGSVCWKVWMLQTSLNKQISPQGKYEEHRQTPAPRHEQRAPIAALKDGLFCAETAAPTWCMINVVMPRLFSSCVKLFSHKCWLFFVIFRVGTNFLQSGFTCRCTSLRFLPRHQCSGGEWHLICGAEKHWKLHLHLFAEIVPIRDL